MNGGDAEEEINVARNLVPEGNLLELREMREGPTARSDDSDSDDDLVADPPGPLGPEGECCQGCSPTQARLRGRVIRRCSRCPHSTCTEHDWGHPPPFPYSPDAFGGWIAICQCCSTQAASVGLTSGQSRRRADRPAAEPANGSSSSSSSDVLMVDRYIDEILAQPPDFEGSLHPAGSPALLGGLPESSLALNLDTFPEPISSDDEFPDSRSRGDYVPEGEWPTTIRGKNKGKAKGKGSGLNGQAFLEPQDSGELGLVLSNPGELGVLLSNPIASVNPPEGTITTSAGVYLILEPIEPIGEPVEYTGIGLGGGLEAHHLARPPEPQGPGGSSASSPQEVSVSESAETEDLRAQSFAALARADETLASRRFLAVSGPQGPGDPSASSSQVGVEGE